MHIPDFTSYNICLRFTRAVTLKASHYVFVNGIVTRILGHPLPSRDWKKPPPWIVAPCPILSAAQTRTSVFESRDALRIGLTFVGRGFPTRDTLLDLIHRAPDRPTRGNTPWDFTLEDLSQVPPANLTAEARRIASLRVMTLDFVTPLEIKQPFPGCGYVRFDAGYFSPVHFFEKLYNCMHDLSKMCRDDVGPLEGTDRAHG
jgi:hypothetical protein